MPEEQASSAPERITLDDLIETVTRSVMRAMAAEGEVAGYALQQGGVKPQVALPPLNTGTFGHGPIIIGLIFNPQAGGTFQAQ